MSFNVSAHGPGGVQRSEERATITEAVNVQETGIPVTGGKKDRIWGVSATTGWESRHVHYGVDESGSSGAYVNEAGVQIGGFSVNVWNGFGLGNDLIEWDFTAAYNFEAGPIFLTPGYNLRYVPRHAKEEGEDEHSEEEHGEEHAEHAHNMYGNELFFAAGTTAIPYVTPSAVFIWDLNNLPGAFLEFRLDGDVPVYKEIVSLQPYALLGLNFGYNTTDAYGLNNLQFGLQGTVAINKYVSAFAGINYSVALEALDAIDQDNVVWVNVGLSFAY
ncbi:MAG: hypothetical protein JHD33_04340 [Chthoniobacterales bacterium]|nr:hypothetical protein [Chthoniobacterales bacterium]